MAWYYWTLIVSIILLLYAIISYAIWYYKVGKYQEDEERWIE